MPIQFNEPLSCKYFLFMFVMLVNSVDLFFKIQSTVLQRLTEHMEYSDLLNLANASDDPLERMQV